MQKLSYSFEVITRSSPLDLSGYFGITLENIGSESVYFGDQGLEVIELKAGDQRAYGYIANHELTGKKYIRIEGEGKVLITKGKSIQQKEIEYCN